ncbi:related to tumor susceptibility gene 101 [Lecanosticta acicola]|uniref:Related to tumor susceptibility gene 101 n=1 Tax=Lecanosticta acicola TaxID=111012 RepID=A0AAI9EDG5_9PEZI|nr:related to tumor susceptibility gene 101 [Lecanosticta acicola]
MASLPDKVLSWLYGVLHEYRDPQRTYSDAARTLAAYPTLSPRTEVYTYEDGASALLLTLWGTLPVAFRGTIYRFPVKLWFPHNYPQEAPMAYVIPEKDMLIRPGQHVGVDGRIYHPYLRDWAGMWDRASIAEFLEYLQQVFGKEPPVISRAQQQQYQRQLGPGQTQQRPGASQTPPQPPPKQRVGNVEAPEGSASNAPPPLPPKPGEEYAEPARNTARDGPPLPPLPPEATPNQPGAASSGPQNDQWQSPRASSYPSGAGYQNGRPLGPSPLPSMPYPQAQYQQMQRSNHDRSPVSPISPANGYSKLPESKYSRPAPLPQAQYQQSRLPPPQTSRYPPQPAEGRPQYAPGRPQPFQPTPYPAQQVLQQAPQKTQPPPDLLSDPFEVALPERSGPAPPAPPIPPNPEKEHLLQAISGTLVQQAQQKVNQNLSAVAPLQAQQQAMRTAYAQLEGEIRQLEQLDQALSSNEAILHRSIQECDRTIATAKSKRQPPIDDVLIAPTMVANQLWMLCAEEAACREAMYVLQKAVDRGRVSGNDFVRQMRGLGRERFLKMALARKCARGMGLELQR